MTRLKSHPTRAASGPSTYGQGKKIAGAGGDIEDRAVDYNGKAGYEGAFPYGVHEKGHQARYPVIFWRHLGKQQAVVVAFCAGTRKNCRIIFQFETHIFYPKKDT